MEESGRGLSEIGTHLGIAGAMLIGVIVGWMAAGAPVGLGIGLVGLLLLYLLGFRSLLREELRLRRELEARMPVLRALSERFADEARGPSRPGGTTEPETAAHLPGVRKRFALGTVAVLEGSLEPQQVEAVAREQERRPGKRFGLVAVELGLLTLAQLADLVRAQREGRFSLADMRRARKVLIEARRGSAPTDGQAREPGGP